MPFKLNISEKGKTFKLEAETEFLIGKKIGEKIPGEEVKKELEGYELEITGTSDIAGFPGKKDVEGSSLRKLLFKKGWGMKGKKRRRKKVIKIKGLRLKKTIRGNTISKDSVQINTKVIKSGVRRLEEIFPEQVKVKEAEKAEVKEDQGKLMHKKPEVS